MQEVATDFRNNDTHDEPSQANFFTFLVLREQKYAEWLDGILATGFSTFVANFKPHLHKQVYFARVSWVFWEKMTIFFIVRFTFLTSPLFEEKFSKKNLLV